MKTRQKKLLLLTHSFPFGKGETFLADEFPHLTKHFSSITIFPLVGDQKSRIDNQQYQIKINIEEPLLNFDLKDKKSLLIHGLFNTAPLLYSIKEYFQFQIYKNRNKTWLFFTSLLTTRSIIANNKKRITNAITNADILYSYWGDKTADTIPYFRSRIKPFPTTIVRFHGSDLYEEAKGYIPFRTRLFKNIDIACPISENGAEYLKQRYPAQIKSIRAFHLGSKNHQITPPVPKSGEPFHLLSCSNMIPLKRVEIIARALQNIHTPIIWTHIGEGPTRPAIEKIKPNDPEVKYEILGWLSKDQIFEYYKTHHIDLFLNTSKSEGIPVSIMEALSFGIPTLATDVGGTKEIINTNTGELLPKDLTPEKLLESINKYISKTTEERTELRNSAITEWKTLWNGDTNYETFATFISQLSQKT